MPSIPGGRRSWEVSALLVVAVVIVATLAFTVANLGALDGASPRTPAPIRNRSSTGPPDPVLLVVLWVLEVGLVAVLIVMAFRRRAAVVHRRPFSWWELLPPLVALILFLLLLDTIPRSLSPQGNATTTPEVGGGAPLPGDPALASGWPLEAVLLLAVLALLLWITYRVRSGIRPAAEALDGPPAAEEVRSAAAEAIEETIRDLEVGADVRAAILACYQRFCGLLRSRGIADQDPLTPRELEGLAIRRFRVSPEASASLTSLFEEARYSEHALDEVHRERAIESLGRIRAALEA